MEYTAPEPPEQAEDHSPTLADQAADRMEPAAPTLPVDVKAADDSKAAASEFGDDLAASLSAEQPSAPTGEPAETTPIPESTPPPASVVGERYSSSESAETSSNDTADASAAAPDNSTVEMLLGEPVDPNTPPPNSPVNDSMLPEQREAIAETSEAPIPNLDDDEIQTPPAVQTWNTRRAAWLLGSKLSLAALANEHGASEMPVQKLFGQSSALAKKLGLSLKELPSRPAADAALPAPDPAIDYLLTEGQVVGSELASRQGADHAALFEVAVKSNVLLVVYQPGAPITKNIAAAIERASESARLPATLRQPLLDALAAKESLPDVRKAVWKLHEATDKYLDETAPR